MAPTRGTAVALLGVGLFAAMLVVGAATAPSRTVAGAPATPVSTATPTPAADVTSTAGTPTRTGTPTATPTAVPQGPRTLVGVQGNWGPGGNVRMYSGTAEVWRESSADGYFEVSTLPDGTVLAAFANESATDCGDLEAPCARTGFRHIDPTAPGGPRVVAEYSFPVDTLTNSEVHAVDRVGPGEYVFTDMNRERVVVVENGTVTWQWNASARYDAPPDPTSRDWLHINDVDVIDENHFLVSVRNANQLVVLERGAGVVEVINEDDGGSDETCTDGPRLADFDGEDGGDVICGDPSVIREQHNPQWIGPGAVMVADSENDRVVELQRTADGDWEVVWGLGEAAGLALDWPRDADLLPNGNVLVTDSLNRRVFEVTRGGEVVWSVSTTEPGNNPHIPYEADRLPYGEVTGPYGAPATTTGTGTATDSTTATEPGATPTTTPRFTLETATAGGDVSVDTGSDVPVLSLAVAGLQGTFGWLPVWFGEVHLAVVILSVVLVVGGGVDRWRNPDREVTLPGGRE